MRKFVTNMLVAVLAAITVAAPLADAQARDWRRHGGPHRAEPQIFGDRGAIRRHHREYRRHHHRPRHVYRHRHRDNDDGVALGIIGGLAAGAILGGVLSNQQPVYRTQPQRVIRYSGSLEPWTRAWFEYCDDRYRSFNPSTGTFRGYDGQDHFCVAN